jgi:hypothetical protein
MRGGKMLQMQQLVREGPAKDAAVKTQWTIASPAYWSIPLPIGACSRKNG